MSADDMPPPEPLASLMKQRADAVALLTKIHNAFFRDADGGNFAYLGPKFYDEIKGVLGINRPHVVEG